MSLLLLVNITTTTFALDTSFDNPVPINKVWTIKFNLPLDTSTINSNTVYITDSSSKTFSIKYEFEDRDKTLKVIPIGNFQFSSEYFLHIENVKSKSGKILKEPFRMRFITEEASEDAKVQARKEEIQQRYDALKSQLNKSQQIFDEKASYVYPYNAGTLNSAFINDGLLMTNFIRFLAYLNDNVQMLDDWNIKAQHAAALNMINDTLTHFPTKPSDMSDDFYELGAEGARTSNIYWGYDDLEKTIIRYMSDSDRSNIDTVGHRRWIINPYMEYVGFGYAYTEGSYFPNVYSAMKVFDNQHNTVWGKKGDFDFIAWPSQVAFPIEFFDDHDPWSVSLNHEVYDNTKIGDIKVTLNNLTLNKKWTFTKEDLNEMQSNKFYNIDTGLYGIPFCIIFRPDNISYNDGDVYEVTIENIYDKQGQKIQIKYRTVTAGV